MNFNSGAFLIFLPVVVAVYWILPVRFRKYWLLAVSCYFYMYWNPILILLLLTSTVIDYSCSRGMEKWPDNRRRRKLFLLISIIMNLGILFFFKYWDFFGESVNAICGKLSFPYRVPALHLILPVGISFYTFQTMSYSIDVYRGDVPAEHDFVSFALYVSFFPQLVAGPIENARDLLPQLKEEHRLNREDLSAGFRLLLSGFFRKCVVADYCGQFVNRIYADLPGSNSIAVAAAGALFCIQMYCDFAGYSEIAAGSARLMGIRLMKNFDRPYLSQSYAEFFRRWHISLNRWFTNYLYIPLGGSRKGPWRKLLNTVIVFALCGLWHGARWTYVLWGLYAAFFVCLESVLARPAGRIAEKLKLDLANPLVKLARRGYMFLIFIPAALLFRAESMEQTGVIFSRLFSGGVDFSSALQQLGVDSYALVQLTLVIVVMTKLHNWGEYDLPPAKTTEGCCRRMVSISYLVLIIALCWLALLATQDAAGFAYFQF